jgi:hypothetical protein
MIALLAALAFAPVTLAQAEPPPAAVSERPSASTDPEALKRETPAAEDKAPLFDPVTKVDGKFVQVVKGARAVFHLGDDRAPVLDKAETGLLAAAHPIGTAKEEFAKPDKGQLAFAVDGSAEKRASYLKVWNGLDYPVAYKAIILVLQPGGKTAPVPVKTCAVAPGATDLLTWPRPVIAVAVTEFTRAADPKACK